MYLLWDKCFWGFYFFIVIFLGFMVVKSMEHRQSATPKQIIEMDCKKDCIGWDDKIDHTCIYYCIKLREGRG